MEKIFYFKHSILNTPCPLSLGASLRDLKTIFYNWFFKFISHQAFSPSVAGVMPAAPQPPPWAFLQPEGFRRPPEPSPAGGFAANGRGAGHGPSARGREQRPLPSTWGTGVPPLASLM